MGTASPSAEEVQLQLDNLRGAIREIAHEINNPLGVLRMATYFLESADAGPEKKAEYFKVMSESIDKIEENLNRLRAVRENPGLKLSDLPPKVTQ
jgi:nitrogen-specific signal transduction histidine kinase